MVGGENAKSDPNPEPNGEATLLSLSPLYVFYLEGPDDFSFPFPPYPITYVQYKYPEHAPSNGIDVDDVDDDNDKADIRALLIRDVERL